MIKKIIPITVFISALLFLSFFGKPYLRRKDALKVVHSVLSYWENGNLSEAMPFWERKDDFPPVYDLLTYEIGKKTFGKKDGVYNALVAVTLYFSPSNRFPSGKEWIFELNKTRYGWKIIDFRLSANQTSQ